MNLHDELIAEFVSESQELLSSADADLRSLAALPPPPDPDSVQRLYRSAHSIKGSAGLFGFQQIRQLAQRTEMLLDLLRSRQIPVSAELLEVLHRSFEKLRALVADTAASQHAEISSDLESLTHLAEQLSPGRRAEIEGQANFSVPGRRRIIALSHFDLEQARRGDRFVYLLTYDMLADIQRRQQTPLALLRRLARSGSILDSRVDLEAASTLEDFAATSLFLEVLYSTPLPTPEIAAAAELSASQIILLDNDGRAHCLGEAAVPQSIPPHTALPQHP